MAVASPYAVFTALDRPWTIQGLAVPPPAVVIVEAVQATAPRRTLNTRSSGRQAWSSTVQGELFQLL